MNVTAKLLLAVSFLLAAGGVNAKSGDYPIQVRHQEPTLIERGTPFELTFTVPGINPDDVQEAYVFYKLDGAMGFSQKKASLLSSDFKVTMTVDDKQVTSLQYYFKIILNNGKTVTYPQNEASQEPVAVEVIKPRKTERERRVKETGVDYTILSPNPGTTVAQSDVVVALTLFYDPAEVDTANTSFQLLVDGQDVSSQANASDYFYTYTPDDLSPGQHSATFNLQKPDTTLMIATWDFSVLDPSTTVSTNAGESETWMPGGQVEFSARSQQVGGYPNDALSGNVRFSGEKGDISYSAFGLLTSQEDKRLQPQNRFGANLYIGDWLELEAGHVYPTLSTLTIAGQRIQGVNAGFHAWNDAVNLQLVYGKLRRGIDNIYSVIEANERSFEGAQNSVTNYSLSVQDGKSGTFRRKVMGGRLGFGRDRDFNVGLNFLKVQDDTASIRLINDFNEVMNQNPDLADNLNQQHVQELQNNPQQLSVSGNPSPKDNFVAATDVRASFDDDQIQFQADAAASLLNQDISEGTLTQETADNLGLTLGENTESLLDRLSWLIIINENMNALPLRFQSEESGTTAEAFFPKSILATQSELRFNYFDNNLRVRYRWVGPSYNSLANTTVRKDIAGFNISDRFQLFQNRIYVTLGYERLRDNVINNKDATTNTITYRGNVSWYPIDQDLPRVSVGLMNRNRDNDVALNNPLVAGTSGIAESAAVQNIVIQNGDTLSTPNPRLSNTYQLTASISQEFSVFGVTNDASLNYSMLNTEDAVFNYGDSKTNSFSMRVVNRYQNSPLQTNFGFNINNTTTTGGLTDIQIKGFNVGATAFLLDDKLNVDASVAFTKNRSETVPLAVNTNNTQALNDDYYQPNQEGRTVTENSSYVISAGGRYNLNEQHSFLLNFRYSNIRSAISAVGIPNDHLLQARYIFNF